VFGGVLWYSTTSSCYTDNWINTAGPFPDSVLTDVSYCSTNIIHSYSYRCH
jgi:hypothetical protein